jgi:hypothetical protein
VDAVLTGTPVWVALLDEGEARVKPVKCTRFISDRQGKSRKPKLKKMFEEVTCLKRTTNAFVLNVRNITRCPEPLRNGSRALHVTNGPIIAAADSASVFVASANLTTMLTMTSVERCDEVIVIALDAVI